MLKVEVQIAQFIAIITNMGRPPTTRPMGITGHWTDDQFNIDNRCIAIRPAPGSYTADYIAAEVNITAAE